MDLLDYYKTAEMIGPSLSPRPPRGTLGAGSSAPVFMDEGGNVITSVVCGQSYTFDVPGYKQVWLTEYRAGEKIFDGLFNVPMPSYLSDCMTDVGIYNVLAYDPASGILLGQTNFTINPASVGPAPPPPGTVTTPGSGPVTPGPVVSGSTAMSPALLIGGLVALWLLTR